MTFFTFYCISCVVALLVVPLAGLKLQWWSLSNFAVKHLVCLLLLTLCQLSN